MYKYFIVILVFACLDTECSYGQYRDPFAEKAKKKKIKKRNKTGLFGDKNYSKTKLKKGSNPFSSSYNKDIQKGVIGLGSNPFSSNGRKKYKPTGVDKGSFNYKMKRRAFNKRYNRNRAKEAIKSRNNYFRIHYKY